jgi:hypothetical protein
MRKRREVLDIANYITLGCNEVTIVENQGWINI